MHLVTRAGPKLPVTGFDVQQATAVTSFFFVACKPWRGKVHFLLLLDFAAVAGNGPGFFWGLETPKLIRRNPKPLRSESNTFIVSFLFNRPGLPNFFCHSKPDFLNWSYFVGAGALAAAGAAGVPLRMSSAAGGSGLSALASSRLTCHIWLSVSTFLKDGMPVSRIPLATFQ
jgi:hypothetical protein